MGHAGGCTRLSSLLCESDATLADVAFRLSYQSEAVFSRASKRFVGCRPGAARRAPAE